MRPCAEERPTHTMLHILQPQVTMNKSAVCGAQMHTACRLEHTYFIRGQVAGRLKSHGVGNDSRSSAELQKQ